MAQQRMPQITGAEGLAGRDARPTEFPYGWAQCEKCKTKYCSREVYRITHEPPYEFRCKVCPPGEGLYLRWKAEKHQGLAGGDTPPLRDD